MIRALLSALFLLLSFTIQAQYLENFSTPNKGYLVNMQDDFTGVGWTLSNWNKQPPNSVGRDSSDYFQTTAAGVLESVDIDNEVCWESPLINISAAGTVSFSAKLVWNSFDNDVAANSCVTASDIATLDYIKVLYSVNGGGFTMIPNQVGGATCATIGYANGAGTGINGSTTITQGGISGSTLKIRICVGTNANAEIVQIDSVRVPQAGVTTGCAAPSISTLMTQSGSCNGANGAIRVTATGATPGYNVAWAGTSSGNPAGIEIASSGGSYTISPLNTGTYTITVTDAASCSATTSVAVTAASALSLSPQVLNASCSGTSDGEINLGVSNGVPPYTYSWSNLPGSPDPQDQTGLATGTYTVTVTDNAGCTATTSATIGVSTSGPYLETFSTPNRGYLTNFADDFAGVNWTMSSWDNQPPATLGRDNTDYFQTTAGGVLEALDLDQEVCWLSPVLNIASSGPVTFNVPVTWNGFDNEDYINVSYSLNGGAFVTLPNAFGGGAGTIQYPFPTVDQSGSFTVTKTGLTGNTLQIKACANSNSDSEIIQFDNIGVPQTVSLCLCPTITFTATPTAACSGGSNGQIAVSGVTGGGGPYMYSKDNGANFQAGATFTGLAANTYQVVVKDASGCLSGATAVVVASNQFTSGSVFTETMGTAPSTTTIAAHEAANGFDNDGFTMSGSGDVRNTSPSSGYTGASGLGNIFLTNTSGTNFQIADINTSAYPAGSLALSFGLLKTTTASNGSELSVQVSSDGTNYTPLSFSVPTGSGTANTWMLVSPTGTIPSTANLRIRFTNTSATPQFRVDDVALSWSLPSASITPGGPTTFCAGNSVNLTASSGSSWQWSNSATTQSISANATGAYSVVITAPNGCTASAGPTNVTVNPLPNCSVNGSSSACAGSTGNTYSATAGMSAYSWSISGNGSFTSGTSGSSVTVTAGASGSYTVSVTITNGNGCVSNCSKTVNINPLPACAISGPDSVCANSTGNAYAATAGMSAYNWGISGSGTITGGTTGSSVMVTAGASGSYTLNVTITDGNGCISTCSKTSIIKPTPPCTVNGPTPVCGNSTGNVYSVNNSGFPITSYSWGISGNGIITSGTTGSSVTVTAGPSGTYTVSVTSLGTNNCPSTCSMTVTINSAPTPNITGPAAVCSGGNATLDAGAGYASYAWSNSGGSSQTATFNSITSPTTYTVTVTDGNNCSGTDTHAVNVNANPTPNITGPAAVCSGGNATLDAGSGYASYAWSNSGGSGQTATFNNILAPTTYTVTVTDGNSCTGTDTHAVNVNANPAPNITGPTSVCSGGSVTLDAGAGYTSYTWSNSGGGGQTATFNNVTSPTIYTVTVTNANNCSGTDTHSVSVNANPTPAITGPTAVCSGGNVTLDAGAGYTSYAWSNSGGSSQTATYNNVTSPTTYTVTVTDGNGCTGTDNQAVGVNANPPAPTITGPTSPICPGSNATLDAGAGYASYAWSNSGGSGQTATYNNIPATTTYTVTVTNANSCSSTGTFTVTTKSCIVDFSGQILFSNNTNLGVKDALVSVTGSATGSNLTDINGNFSIVTTVTTGNFTLKPTKTVNKLNGLTVADATAIQQHVANTTLLPDLYKYIAADVNKSNSITTLDASIISQALLGNPSALNQIATSWRFVPTNYTLTNPPWGFPEQRTYTGITGSQPNQDFYGIKTGDVASIFANPANFGAGTPLVLRTQDRLLQAGQTVDATFNAGQLDDLAAFQLALTFDPAQVQLLAAEPLTGLPLTADNFGLYNQANGEIRVLWSKPTGISVAEAAPAFRLRFTALQNGARLSDVLRQEDAILPGLSYTAQLAESGVELRFDAATGTGGPAAPSSLSMQVRPNPFRETTTVSFTLPAAGEAQLRVTDVAGKLIFDQKRSYPSGKNEETLQLKGITGILFAELVTEQGSVVRKMLAVD